MGAITVRLATLADAAAITELHKSTISRWERIGPNGAATELPYETLSLFERWQHGGPWLSIETCAVHLNRLLAGSGIPLVAELDGVVRAHAEVYESFEPAPFGHNLELSVIVTHTGYMNRGLGTALIKYIVEMARLMKCERLTVSHAEARGFYEKLGFRHTRVGRGVRLTAQAGRVVYQTADLTDRSPAQIKNWYMPLGRYRSSRQEWEKLFPQDWAAGLPDMLTATNLHIRLSVSGGLTAILFVRDADEVQVQPGEVHAAVWASRPLTPMLITALRDWAFRQNYRAFVSFAWEHDLSLLGNEVQVTDYSQEFYEYLV